MTKSKVTIYVGQANRMADDHLLLVGGHTLRSWGMAAHSSVQLRFGAMRSTVRVAPLGKPGQLRMSEGLAGRLGIHHGASLRIAFRPSSGIILIGPVIGILVPYIFPHQPERLFGGITSWCREVVEACRRQGAFVYFFTPGGIAAQGNQLEGWTYAGGWRKGSFPIPDIIHNRLTSRKFENKSNVQKLFKESKEKHGTEIFNEKYLDKTEVFAALKKLPSLLRYLPESHAFMGMETLKAMATKYRILFMKPIRGSLGKGIIRIQRLPGGGFACHFSEQTGTRRVISATLSHVYSLLSPRFKAQKFQIQQGLPIATAARRPVDFRALVQKGVTGKWELTSLMGRIAGPHHFVSNLAKGGAITPARTAINRANIPISRKGIAIKELQKAALLIANGVDATIESHFGELGIDLAVDRTGRVWLLEVNSKPSKNEQIPQMEGKIRPSVKMLIGYARYLARL
jgi:glutathione synthase/RimK-type ligase-like ATP-grasp enzyme